MTERSDTSATTSPEFQQARLKQLLKDRGLKKGVVVRSDEAVVVHVPQSVFGKQLDTTQALEEIMKASGIEKFSIIATAQTLPIVPFTLDCFAVGLASNESKMLAPIQKPKWVSVDVSSDHKTMSVSLSMVDSFESRKHVAQRFADMANYAFHKMGTTNIQFETMLTPVSQFVGLRLKKL